MGIRESLKDHAGYVRGAVLVLLLICIFILYKELHGSSEYSSAKPGQELYSDDDGKTWFFEDAAKGSPFDHNGRQAYRALVFRCGSTGRPFVAYLAKYSDEQLARWRAESARSGGPSRVSAETPRQLKKPGDTRWITTTAAVEYPAVHCPDGAEEALRVTVFDPNNGAN